MFEDLGTDVYVLGIWFVCWKTGDYMAMVTKPKGAPEFKLQYRFRHYDMSRPDPFDHNDRKNWWAGNITETTETKLIAIMDFAMSELGAAAGADIKDKIVVQGDGPKAFNLMKDKPWFHYKEAPAAN